MIYSRLIACLVLMVPASTALAGDGEPEEHFDVFIGRPPSGSQTLVGGALVPDELNLTERVFEGDMEPDSISGNEIFTGTEPGFLNAGSNSPGLLGATNPSGALPLTPGKGFVVNNIEFKLEGVTSNLFYWDGSGSVSFVDSSADLVITQTGGMAGSDGSIDDHPIFDIDDPASLSRPVGGIYLAPLTVEHDDLTPSDPIFVLFVTDEQFEDAVEMAEEFVAARVPEPSAFVIISLAAVASLLVRRRCC